MIQAYYSKYWKIEFDSNLKREYITVFEESCFLTNELFILELTKTIRNNIFNQNNYYVQTMLLDIRNAHFSLNYSTFVKLIEIIHPIYDTKSFKKIALLKSNNKYINIKLQILCDLFENVTEYKFFQTNEQAIEWLNE